MSTDKNLAAAFAGESQANRKYLAFAKQADSEGHTQAAKLFRAAAEAETIHALAHLKAMGVVKSTAENLKAAVEGETYEFEAMYPDFIKIAKEENHAAAARTFTLANEAEKVHAELYKKALANMSNGETYEYYICSVCGHIAEKEAPERCPICGAKAQAYKTIG
ncbi:rubrerythrin family protein [Sporomusa acidovorans]|uniref:Nigerythrin n=1 Tax=Sporomusa acidovorans (strain ATCC 49682 / DSM 3132 / Mol) TaxID=1123286 RepID=A0ABZ3IXB3_SPOA4|nr:rubrerythrin family protein [Sporomusa acidovorans]OZC13863.1 nigerythrin [Sporomusa acidovorans DSM 3132]SDF48342.1 Rubrerythrin [Sporomusa acidovorans]